DNVRNVGAVPVDAPEEAARHRDGLAVLLHEASHPGEYVGTARVALERLLAPTLHSDRTAGHSSAGEEITRCGGVALDEVVARPIRPRGHHLEERLAGPGLFVREK